jgi:hypothetical protein
MQEPVYVMKDGTNVPYVPVEVKTARDAYAASLHVLFKHVADFHLCVVRTFSVKYGIPEDDILKTIQESDEFKNMHVDPVLCMDMGMNSFGPLEKVPVPESNSEVITAPVTAPVTVPVKSKVKKTKKSEPEPEPPTPVAVATEESRPDADPQPELIKPKTIRKKIVAPKAVDPITPTPISTPTPEPPTPVAVVATEEVRPDADPQPELIKPKTIRKKIVPKPTQPITEPEKVAPAAAPATIAPTANTENTTRKIIKKNASK